MNLYPFEGKWPRIHPTAWIAPTAAIIGDVEIGPGSSVWYHCVLRGDTNFIRIGERVNIQDGSILHVNAGREPCIVDDLVTIGHACIVHACTLRTRAFVGMGATVLDGAVMEEGAMLAAGSLLPPGKAMGRYEQWLGNPAKLRKLLTEEERAGFDRTALHYAELAQRHRGSLP